MVRPVISVIICTYNRAAMLARALETICNQTLDRNCYEIVVVDNNSTDPTRGVVEQCRLSCPELRYCFEEKQGLSHARNHGWKQARGSYVAYIDDDCEVPTEWLTVAQEIITQSSPVAFGGPIRNTRCPRMPDWYKDSYLYRETITSPGFLPPGEYWRIVGMNMFFRRDLIDVIGQFDPALGMRGENVAYGEETAFLEAVAKHFPDKLYFDPRLYVYDIMRPEKMRIDYVLRASFAAGRSFRRRKPRGKTGRGILLAKGGAAAVGFILDFARACIYRDRQKYPFIQNFLYECGGPRLQKLGDYYEQLCPVVGRTR